MKAGETDAEGWENKTDGHIKKSRRWDHFNVFEKCVLRGAVGYLQG